MHVCICQQVVPEQPAHKCVHAWHDKRMREISTHLLFTNPPYAWQVEKAPLESYADVGGLEQQVQEIKEAVELPLTHPELYEDIGIKPPKARAAPTMHACWLATLG